VKAMLEEAARERAASVAPASAVEPDEEEVEEADEFDEESHEGSMAYQQAAEALHIPSRPSRPLPASEVPHSTEAEPVAAEEELEDEDDDDDDDEEGDRVTPAQTWAADSVRPQEFEARDSGQRDTLQNPTYSASRVLIEEVRWELQELKDEVAQLRAEVAELKSRG
jgi:hypothetical protein